MNYNSDDWLISFSSGSPKPDLRVICFPFAGGGTVNYARWRADLYENIDLCAINLPGRERFFGKTCLTNYRECITNLVELIKNKADCPLVFYGHSFGGLTAYFTSMELDRLNGINPKHVFISGRTSPGTEVISPIGEIDREQFKHILLHRYQGVPPQIAESDELLNLFIPMIQSDFRMYEQYPNLFSTLKQQEIKSDITTIGYTEDEFSIASLLEWGHYTQGSHKHIQLPGGHFEILRDWSLQIRLINELCNNTK